MTNQLPLAVISVPFLKNDQSTTAQSGSGSELKPLSLANRADYQVLADDQGVTRGYGAFEVIHGYAGELIATGLHLDRLVRSCRQLDLPEPNLELWQQAMKLAIETANNPEGEFVLRLVITSGFGDGSSARGWVSYELFGDSIVQKRQRGLRAKLLNRGIPARLSNDCNWLLVGVKSLSYGPNLMAIKTAQKLGYDEAIYVSSDDYLLEAPTASLLLLRGETLIAPDHGLGVLPGTTQIRLFELAEQLGLKTEYASLTVSDLNTVDAAWLTASMRLVTPLFEIDDYKFEVKQQLTDQLNQLFLASGS